jgi:hypothetical protein
MSYHRFPNMRDLFQSQLSAKMIENVKSPDFNTRERNCRSPSGNFQHGNVCRVHIVVYQVKCKTSGKIHIGNTQRCFKNRMRSTSKMIASEGAFIWVRSNSVVKGTEFLRFCLTIRHIFIKNYALFLTNYVVFVTNSVVFREAPV